MLRSKAVQFRTLQLRNLLPLGHRFRHWLTIEIDQFGLVVKRVQVTHAAGHVQPYHAFGLGGKVQRF